MRSEGEYLLRIKFKEKEMQQDPSIYFFCPITHKYFVDPVVAADGYTYERKSIESWFRRNHNRSPITNQPIGTVLIPNRILKSLQEFFKYEVQPYYEDLERSMHQLNTKLAQQDTELAQASEKLLLAKLSTQSLHQRNNQDAHQAEQELLSSLPLESDKMTKFVVNSQQISQVKNEKAFSLKFRLKLSRPHLLQDDDLTSKYTDPTGIQSGTQSGAKHIQVMTKKISSPPPLQLFETSQLYKMDPKPDGTKENSIVIEDE